MKTKMDEQIMQSSTLELSKEELVLVNGGGFAYDFGFFLREMVVYIANGGGITGTSAAVSDVCLNYKPAN